MSSSNQKRNGFSKAAEFYEGKSIFLTGATGFLGVVILEILLQNCPGIRSIFILLRGRKDANPEKRLNELFQRKIFTKLRNEKPEVFNKVQMVEGDVSKPELGLSEEDTRAIINEVSIVFHCAACTFFLKPITFLLQTNVVGTSNVIRLCKKLKTLDAFVYTSTAYSNSNRLTEIEERVYSLPYPAKRFEQELKLGNFDVINALVEACRPPWPNNYCMSKCMAENMVTEQAVGLPFAIIRPSVICMSWKGSMPGYAEENSNLAQLCLAIGKGFLKVAHADPDNPFDIIPADIVANAHVLAAWLLATERKSSPLIVNCTSYGSYEVTLSRFLAIAQEFIINHPLPNTLRSNIYCWIFKNKAVKEIVSLFEHYFPAYGLDLLLILGGKRPKLVALYRFLDKAMATSSYFIRTKWKYRVENFHGLENYLCNEEKQIFYLNLNDLDVRKLLGNVSDGGPFFDWSLDKESPNQRMKIAWRLYVLSRFLQGLSVLMLLWLFYQFFCLVTPLFS